jgi:hypothetical protein
VLARLKVGVFLFDAGMRLVFVNDRVEALAAAKDGLLLSASVI